MNGRRMSEDGERTSVFCPLSPVLVLAVRSTVFLSVLCASTVKIFSVRLYHMGRRQLFTTCFNAHRESMPESANLLSCIWKICATQKASAIALCL